MTNYEKKITFTFRIVFSIAAFACIAYMSFYFLPYSVVAPVFTGVTALFFVFKPKNKSAFFEHFILDYHKSVYYLFFANFTLLAWPYMRRIPISIAFVICTLMSIYHTARLIYRLLDITTVRIDRTKLLFDTLLAIIIIGDASYVILSKVNVFVNLNIIKIFLIINLIAVILSYFILIMLLLTTRTKIYRGGVLFVLLGELLIFSSHFSIIIYLLQGDLRFNQVASFFLLLGSALCIQFYSMGFKGIAIEENDAIRKAACKLQTYVNLGLNPKFLIIAVLPIVLYLNHMIDIVRTIYLLISIVLYVNIIYYFQKRSLAALSLSNQTAVDSSLQDIVDAKTEELREANLLLEELSTTDQLTKLPNRIAFYNYLKHMLKDKVPTFSLLYLDLNKFKLINDIYGHDKGDYVLRIIAERLVALSDSSTKPFRVGGDEFTIVSTLTTKETIDALCRELIAIIEKPIFNNGLIFYLGTSIGIAQYGKDGIDTIDGLVKASDIAMYQTKYDDTSNNFAYFKPKYAETLEAQTEISHKLEIMDFESNFKLFYQPIFDPYTEKIVKIEALIRWQEQDAMIPPGVFIPLSEKNGVIKKITEWVFEAAIKDMVYLKNNYDVDFCLAVNVSPKNIADESFIDYLRKVKADTTFDISNIEIEITENFSVMTLSHIKKALRDIKALGFKISIDDFGTGYSSLEYLKEFSVDTMKIAKELIDSIDQSPSDQKMVSSLIGLSKALSLSTVVEGVETKPQLDVLKSLGCNYIQGYYYAKPMPVDLLVNQFVKVGGDHDTTTV